MFAKMIVSFAVVTLLSFCSPASGFAFLPRVSHTDDAIVIDFAGVGSATPGKALYGQIVDPRFVPLPSFNPYPMAYRQQEQTPKEFVYSYGYPTPVEHGLTNT
ncbi:hypothetical protein DAPPUDRAFT_320630 [Daphnia pulex]|uniref:Uncharacterized protein n=1 Tax=Daphnia pulex TaxID=6669 RepID=E9GQP4_DAPPU|nr:hypothetical protein DAPPUDRAFT_320630 [Daphnia pulex]|eukprot:EFX78149.1 hypothetical protein DAPPUDRAFT_320630 [Daphnia pulex]